MLKKCPLSVIFPQLLICIPWKFNVKKMSFICKILPTVYLHTMEIEWKNKSKIMQPFYLPSMEVEWKKDVLYL